uniref:50S ribosomal protein L21 n=1 Tax=candidate division WWE3 bacterium TaxID=2053526 RepID=A0A831Z182_UNCKA
MEKKKIISKKSEPTVRETLAVLELGGSSHLVRKGTPLTVHRLPIKEGTRVKSKVTVLEPVLKEGTVTYKLVEHLKGPKIAVMKFKAKSRYRKKRGFRAQLSKIVVEKIET